MWSAGWLLTCLVWGGVDWKSMVGCGVEVVAVNSLNLLTSTHCTRPTDPTWVARHAPHRLLATGKREAWERRPAVAKTG